MNDEPLLPHVEVNRIVPKREPEGVAEATAERRELIVILQRIQKQLTEYGRNVGDFHPWRTKAIGMMRIVETRIRFLNQWTKEKNREIALETTIIACGGDLDDPAELVGALRRMVCRSIKDNGFRMTPEEQKTLDAATAYIAFTAREDVSA